MHCHQPPAHYLSFADTSGDNGEKKTPFTVFQDFLWKRPARTSLWPKLAQIHSAAQTSEKHSQRKYNHGLEAKPCPVSEEGSSTRGSLSIPAEFSQTRYKEGWREQHCQELSKTFAMTERLDPAVNERQQLGMCCFLTLNSYLRHYHFSQELVILLVPNIV